MQHDPNLKRMFDDILAHLEIGEAARFNLNSAHEAYGELTSKYHQGLGTTLKPWADKMSDRYEITVDVPDAIVTATRTK